MNDQLDLLNYTPTPEEQGPPPKKSLILEQIASQAFYYRVAGMILDPRLSRQQQQEAMDRLHRIQAMAAAKLSALSPAPTPAPSPD